MPKSKKTPTSIPAPDLTQRPPRSPRQRLGGFVLLPRLLDKGRASLAGKNGEYEFACGLDRRFFDFVKIDSKAVLAQLKAGKGDWDILVWVLEKAGNKPTAWDIVQWSAYQEARTPDSPEAKERVAKAVRAIHPGRTDILTGFDLLDLDDYVTFGGKA